MITVVPYEPAHLFALNAQPAQDHVREVVSPEYAEWLRDSGLSFTVMADNVVLAIMGTVVEWEGRAQCWALLGSEVGRHMMKLTRMVSRYFDLQSYRRLEAQAPENFPPAQRWLELLKFEHEGVMRNYYPDGSSAVRYARIKK